jgi:hypothetical protein
MRNSTILCASALLAFASVCISGCYLPPSMYERASSGPPPEYWQDQARYRPEGTGQPPPPALDPEAAQAPRLAEPERTERTGEGSEVPSAPRPPLYSWDGGVVDSAPQGRVTTQEGIPRGVEAPPAGRMHIIELYQQVLEERDALAREVEELRRHLDETSLALEAKTRAADELTARVAALDEAHRALMAENQTVAARLVQAQIRRLEAEKLLLETRIEAERAKAEESARAAAMQARPGKSKPAAKAGEDEDG